MRGQKGDLYEGGIRVPAIAHWPNQLKAGKFDTPMQIIDWMPTLCALAGYTPEKELKWDGVNLWPMLMGQAIAPLRALYWAGPSFKTSAVRDGDLKLIITAEKGKVPEMIELFDLAKDPHETTNLAAQMPEKVDALRAKMTLLSQADKDASPEP